MLHALARHVPRHRAVAVLTGQLVDLVDIDDALDRALQVAVGGLVEVEDDVFDILTDIARFRGCRRISTSR